MRFPQSPAVVGTDLESIPEDALVDDPRRSSSLQDLGNTGPGVASVIIDELTPPPSPRSDMGDMDVLEQLQLEEAREMLTRPMDIPTHGPPALPLLDEETVEFIEI